MDGVKVGERAVEFAARTRGDGDRRALSRQR
jgi:hypothetical protein